MRSESETSSGSITQSDAFLDALTSAISEALGFEAVRYRRISPIELPTARIISAKVSASVPVVIMKSGSLPVRCSERVVKSMIQCGDTSKLIFDKMRGVNHSQLARIFYLDQTYDWLFSHSKADNPRQVNKDIKLKSSDMADAYKDINRGSNVITVQKYNRRQQDTNDMRRTDDGDDDEDGGEACS